MSSIIDRNTLERVPQMRTLEAASDIPAGVLVAVNSAKKAVPAADATGLLVIGRAEHAAKQGERITAKAGCFAYDTPNGVIPTLADIGKTVFVADERTVAFEDTTHVVKAGVVFDVDEEGVWVVCGFQNYLDEDDLPDLSGIYRQVPALAAAVDDITLASVTGADGSEAFAAGASSADLIADLLAFRDGLNTILAVLRANGLIAAAVGDITLASVTGEAGGETYDAGADSANLIADFLAFRDGLNAILAALRLNALIATADEA